MEEKNNAFIDNISKSCCLIQNIIDLDVEFIDNCQNPQLELTKHQFPSVLQKLKNQHYLSTNEYLKNKPSNYFYFHTNDYYLNYIAVSIWRDKLYKGSVIFGPFLTDIPDNVFISKVISENNLSLYENLNLQQFYRNLPIISANECLNIGNLITNLFAHTFIEGQVIFSDNNKNTNEKVNFKEEKIHLDPIIEMRYKIEKELLHAVEIGGKEEACRIKNRFFFDAAHRVPNNNLRSYKNLTFTLSALLRIAAENGGLHPVYIHSISDKFAIEIENAKKIIDLQNLENDMIIEYCDAVKSFSSKGYSAIVQKAINYINLNYINHLSLNSVAESIHINSSYLSKKFKKETNMTVTEFINRKKIEEAKFLIEQDKNLITDIAYLVGFNNHNYFCRVFKNITSLTPSQYIKEINK